MAGKFSVLGSNLFKVLLKFSQNQNFCRLLYYTDEEPLDVSKAPVVGNSLIHQHLRIIPKLDDLEKTPHSVVAILFDSFDLMMANPEFANVNLDIVVACPLDSWILSDNNLRPFLLMDEIDNMLNGKRLAGFAKLKFLSAKRIDVSSNLSVYRMVYNCNEFDQN